MKRDTFDNCIHRLIENARAVRDCLDTEEHKQFAMGRYVGTVEIIREIRLSVPASAGRPIINMRPNVWNVIMRGNMYDHNAILEADYADRMRA